MLSHYTAIVLISVFSMFGMVVGIRGNIFIDREQKRWFSNLFFMLIVVNLAEWGAASLDGRIPWIGIRTAMKFTELTMTPFVAYTVMMTAGKTPLRKLGLWICAANLVLQVLSLFNGCVFFIDDQCVYHRNELYGLYTALFMCNTVLWILACGRYIKQFQIKNVPMLVVILFIEVISMFSQLVVSYLRLDWCFASFGALLYYIYLDMLEQQTDSLTQLLNRRIYEVHIQKLSPGTTVIFFDVDSFKTVNDTYGHNAGDLCLQAMAKEIKKEFEQLGYCYRYGGDEFCVILSKPCENLKDHLSSLVDSIANARFHSDLPLPRLSYGYATLLEGECYEQVLERADEMMYQYKKKHKLK